MKFLKSILINSLLLTFSQCGVINKRSTGSIKDFSRYSGISELITANKANFKTIFKDGPIYSGEGTAYGSATNGGNCLFPKKEYYNDMMYAALNRDQFINDLGCGACALVVSTSNPYKPIRVRIIDQCPECKHGDLDFSDKAYKALTNQSPGRIKITWALIPCDISVENYPALVQKGSPIKFHFKTGSTAHWTEVQVFNTRYPVSQVELKANGKFVKLKRRDYNYWYREGESGFGNGPFDFRVTLADGAVINATGVKFAIGPDEDGTYASGSQSVSGGTKSSSQKSSGGRPMENNIVTANISGNGSSNINNLYKNIPTVPTNQYTPQVPSSSSQGLNNNFKFGGFGGNLGNVAVKPKGTSNSGSNLVDENNIDPNIINQSNIDPDKPVNFGDNYYSDAILAKAAENTVTSSSSNRSVFDLWLWIKITAIFIFFL